MPKRSQITLGLENSGEGEQPYTLLHGPLLKGELDSQLSLPLDEDGCLPVPTGPGLGVELDPEKVKAVEAGI